MTKPKIMNNNLHNSYFPFGILTYNVDKSIIESNETAQTILGIKSNETNLEQITNILDDSILKDGTRIARDQLPHMIVFKSGKPVNNFVMGVERFKTKERIWLSVNAVPVKENKKQKINKVTITLENITEKKEALDKIKCEQEKYQKLIMDIHIPTMILVEGKIRFANKQLEITSGFKRDELIDKNFLEFVHEEDKQKVIENYNKRLAKKTGEERYFSRAIIKDKGFVWVEIEASLTYFENKEAVIVTMKDVDAEVKAKEALKESEIKYRTLLENTGSAILIIDKNGIYQYINKLAAEHLGGMPEDFTGRSMKDVLDKKTANELFQQNLTLIKNGKGRTYTQTFDLPVGKRTLIISDEVIKNNNGEGVAIQSSCIDITQLKETKNLLQNMIDNTEELIWAIDNQYKLIASNSTFDTFNKKILGKTVKQGESVLSLLSNKDAVQFWKNNYTKALNGSTVHIETDAYLDGDIHFFANTFTPMKDESGTIRGVVAVTLDITAKKITQNILTKKDREINSIIENTNVGTWQWDIITGETKFNDRWASILGYTLLELEPISIETWIAHTHPDDLKRSNEKLEDHFNGKNSIYECEVRMKHKNGNYVWIRHTGKVYEWDNDGKPLKMSGIHVDITARKKIEEDLMISNEKLENTISNIPGITFRCKNDESWTMEYMSPQTETITGYKPVDFINNNKIEFVECIDKSDRDRVTREITKAINSNKTYSIEYKIIKKDSSKIWVLERGSGIRNEFGDVESIEGIIIDITDKKQVELLLSESEKKFRQMFDNHTAIKLIIDPDTGKIINANQAAELFYGWNKNELINMTIRDINLNSPEEIKKDLLDVKKNRKTHFTFKHKLKSNEIRAVDVYSTPVKLENNTFLYSIIFDVTARKKAEQQLNLLGEVVEQNPAITFITDNNGVIEYVNNKFEEVTGYKSKDAIGKKPNILKSGEYDSDYYEKLWTNIKAGKVCRCEIKNKKKDGSFYTAKEIISPIVDINTGAITNFVCIQEDISELKTIIKNSSEKDKHIEGILDAIPDLVFRMKRNGEILQYKADNRDLYVKSSDIIGRNILDLLPSETSNLIFFNIEEAVNKNETKIFIYKLDIPNRGVRHYEGRMSPSGENEVTTIVRDITEDITKQNELISAKRKAEESSKLKSAFLATMNHELRTPLNHIMGFSAMIPDFTDNEEIVEFSNMINKSGTSLLNIIEDIFSLAVSEQSNIIIRNEEVYAWEIFQLVKNELKENLESSGKSEKINTLFKIDKSIIQRQIITDKNKVVQVVANLTRNAIKFTELGVIKLSIYMVDNYNMCISVVDSGIGIKEGDIEKIFEFFRQLDDSNSRNYEGIGVGLTIAKKIADAMSGKILVTSKKDVGSEFKFIFPITFPEDEIVGNM